MKKKEITIKIEKLKAELKKHRIKGKSKLIPVETNTFR